ncbi:MAG: dolichyl-phosphate beta-glucosyltransferase [Acidobacteriota bacterium]
MRAEPLLSIVIPAYNEARRLPATLRRIHEFSAARSDLQPVEVLVVDDGSRDDTAASAEASAAPNGVDVRVLRLGENRGKGAAVRTGMAASRGAWVLISDADLASPIEDLDVLFASGAPFVVGSRALRRELIARRQPLPRDLLGRMYNLWLRVLGLTSMADTQCGFKLVEGNLARRLAARQRLDGFAFDVELLARAEREGVRVVEVPVRWRHVEESRVRPVRHGLRMVADAWRLRVWLWLGR